MNTKDEFKLKENSKNPCGQCGSHKYTQTISDKVGVLCKECLVKILDSALAKTMAQIKNNE